MELLVLLVVVAVVVGGAALYRRHAVQQRQAAEQAALETQLSTSKRAADEDVTKFGEELQRLDSDVGGHALDEAMQQDYQRALDAYDDAKMSLDAVTRPEEIRHVTEILEDGRYAVACVKARIAGQPLPAKRPPCFFNPAHGPSSQDVTWAPPGGVSRSVPACPADAERVLAGADPYIRTVQVGPQRVPYWEGGPAYALVECADVLVVLGSSLTVMSGLRFVRHQVKRARPIVIINRGPTRGDELATLKIENGCSETLAELQEALLD